MRDGRCAAVVEQTPWEVQPLPLTVLARLVNGWGDAPRTAAGESDEPYPDAERFRATALADAGLRGSIDESELVRVANLVHPVFEAESGAECAERINGLIAEAGMVSALSSDAWSVHEVWRAPRREKFLLAAATAALIDHLRQEPDASRLSTCAGGDCDDVYVDRSPAARRHYCSITCQNRNRARSYRARRRESGPA